MVKTGREKMKALVIGASGFVGSYLMKALQAGGADAAGTFHAHPAPSLSALDITDPGQVSALIKKISPELICLCAAEPNVDYCEAHPKETSAVNVAGVKNVAEAAKAAGAKLMYFSSDYVFDGRSGPYRETDLPHPVSEYGRQKLESEKIVQGLLKDFLILRVTVLYGWERQGKNFLERLIKTLKKGETLLVPNDQIGNPTLVPNMTEIAAELALKNERGIFHIAGLDWINRYEFAVRIAETFGLDASLIAGVKTSEMKQAAKRPLRGGMLCESLKGKILTKPSSIAEGLEWLKAHPKKAECLHE